jgi:hypothetical protein
MLKMKVIVTEKIIDRFPNLEEEEEEEEEEKKKKKRKKKMMMNSLYTLFCPLI